MYSLPPMVLFNERTGRLELCHAEIARRIRYSERLRKRYRARVLRRAARFAIGWPRRGLVALARTIRARLDAPAPIDRFN